MRFGKELGTALALTGVLALPAGCSEPPAEPNAGPVAGTAAGELPSLPPATTTPSAPATPEQHTPTGQSRSTDIYLETWLEDADYERIARLPLAENKANIIIAFGIPTAEGTIDISDATNNAAGIRKVVNSLGPDATVSLAIGGWGGSDEQHQAILSAFEAGANNPQAFAAQVKASLANLSKQIGHEVNGVDIDWEYPQDGDVDAFVALMKALNDALPGKKISLAVPGGDNATAFIAGLSKWAQYVDAIHVMTYDEHTPYGGEQKAGPQATTEGAKSAFMSWLGSLAAVSPQDVNKASIGFETICYKYNGANGEWDSYQSTPNPEVPYSAIAHLPTVEAKDGSSWVKVEGGSVASCTSPAAVTRILTTVSKAAGKTPTAFFWAAGGLTNGALTAASRPQ